jgi:signal peptidase
MFLGFLFWASALVGMEFSRAYLLSVFTKRNTTLMLALIALFYTLVSFPLARFTNLDKETILPFFGGSALPSFAENILASLFAIVGGPLAAMSYRGIMVVFEWFSPILPNLAWIIKAFVGIIAPVIGLVVVQVLYGETEAKAEAEGVKEEAKGRSSMIGWVITAVVAVIILWFSTGLMGIRPVVIVSGSMTPAIDVGDIVFVREISINDIKKDDVIEYMLGNTPYVHRVIDIQQEGDATVLIVQGDANSSPDPEPVSAEQIKGKVQFRLPKVGWASIGLKNLLGKIF